MEGRGTPLAPRDKEWEARMKTVNLRAYRKLLRRPDMTMEEMEEMNKMNRDDSIKVTFLKRKQD